MYGISQVGEKSACRVGRCCVGRCVRKHRDQETQPRTAAAAGPGLLEDHAGARVIGRERLHPIASGQELPKFNKEALQPRREVAGFYLCFFKLGEKHYERQESGKIRNTGTEEHSTTSLP